MASSLIITSAQSNKALVQGSYRSYRPLLCFVKEEQNTPFHLFALSTCAITIGSSLIKCC